ncbi:MAG TPA: hypothetical protein VMR45_03630 [Patescibacteria group bacterium]|jgi:hypothetical protein|nr:hypothetical protein [Patescibacteria group bacterium]
MSYELLTPETAESSVKQGCDIVVIPYSSYQNLSGEISLGIHSELVACAAAALYRRAGRQDTKVISVGEHTYGLEETSTTTLTYDYLRNNDVPKKALANDHPRQANATPQQILWLKRSFGSQWVDNPPVLIGIGQHWPRIRDLCRLNNMPANFLDAPDYLSSTGLLSAEYAQAAKLYDNNQKYESFAQQLTKYLSLLGPQMTTQAFKLMTWLRTPNVIHMVKHKGKQMFYASTVRSHRKKLRRN